MPFRGLTALSRDYWSLLIFRFFTGIGLGAEWGPGTAIVLSCGHPRRGGALAGALHAAYGVGSSWHPASWLLLNPLGPSSWRYMFVIESLPAFLLLYIRRSVDDPALWVDADRCRREAQKRLEMGVVSRQTENWLSSSLLSAFYRTRSWFRGSAFYC